MPGVRRRVDRTDPDYRHGTNDIRVVFDRFDGFADEPGRCGEKILEAIQMAWIEETE